PWERRRGRLKLNCVRDLLDGHSFSTLGFEAQGQASSQRTPLRRRLRPRFQSTRALVAIDPSRPSSSAFMRGYVDRQARLLCTNSIYCVC
ncbi:unnamed protein product, partial [Polarella glacialis]